jgi:hypothetical protein
MTGHIKTAALLLGLTLRWASQATAPQPAAMLA